MIFFTKNPNLKKKFAGLWWREGVLGGGGGKGVLELVNVLTKNPNPKKIFLGGGVWVGGGMGRGILE